MTAIEDREATGPETTVEFRLGATGSHQTNLRERFLEAEAAQVGHMVSLDRTDSGGSSRSEEVFSGENSSDEQDAAFLLELQRTQRPPQEDATPNAEVFATFPLEYKVKLSLVRRALASGDMEATRIQAIGLFNLCRMGGAGRQLQGVCNELIAEVVRLQSILAASPDAHVSTSTVERGLRRLSGFEHQVTMATSGRGRGSRRRCPLRHHHSFSQEAIDGLWDICLLEEQEQQQAEEARRRKQQRIGASRLLRLSSLKTVRSLLSL